MRSSLLLPNSITGLLFYLAFCPSVTYAQAGWEWQNPLPQGYTLNAVTFSDANNGWSVGNCGTIMHTSDAGNSWKLQASNTTNSLHGVCFTSALTGLAVGDLGLILRTEDGGGTWWLQTSGTGADLLAITFSNPHVGWIVGRQGTILHTTDGGLSWDRQVSSTTRDLSAISFADNRVGNSVGAGGTIRRTMNGGTTWDSVNSGTTFDFRGVASIDATTTIVIGGNVEVATVYYDRYGNPHPVYSYYNTLFRTMNGGVSWKKDSLSGLNGFTDIRLLNSANGWVVGTNGLYRTSDTGRSWSSVAAIGPGSIFFTDLNSGFLVCADGQIFHTTNSGKTWPQTVKNATGAFGLPLIQLFFVNSRVGWCFGSSGGNGGIMHTTDGGNNWSVQWKADPTSTDLDLTSAFFVDVNNGWVLGHYYHQQYGQQQGMILHTSDGGQSWGNQIPALTGIFQPEHAFFVTPNLGWLTQGWTMYQTTNGGKSWPVISSAVVKSFNQIKFIDANIGWAVSTKGQIYRTSNGGVEWALQHEWDTGTSGPLNGIYVKDSNNVWVAGWNAESGKQSRGVALHTSDGGQTWSTQISESAKFGFAQFSFADSNHWWAANSDNAVYRTTNGGKDWESQAFGMTLYSVCFTDTSNGWVTGAGAEILHTSSGGVAGNSGPRVKPLGTQLLFAVYPNPSDRHGASFRIDLPKTTFVKLRILNVLGIEVAALFSNEMTAGPHEIQWDQLNAVPGTYYCELSADQETRLVQIVVSK